jgi:intein/homing endonuclease
MEETFGKYSHVHYYSFSGHYGYKEVVVYSSLDKSFEFLLEKSDLIPQWIIDDDMLFLSFLGGFMDSEGCWYIGRGSHASSTILFQLSSTRKEWLDQIQSKLDGFGIKAFIHADKKVSPSHYGSKIVYDLQVRYKHQVVSLAEKLLSISKHSEKIQKMFLVLKGRETIKWMSIREDVVKLRQFIKQEAAVVRYGDYPKCACSSAPTETV